MIWIVISLLVLLIICAVCKWEVLGSIVIASLLILGILKFAIWGIETGERHLIESMNDVKYSEILEYNNKEYHSKGYVVENFDTYRFIDIETDREVILPINNTKRKK